MNLLSQLTAWYQTNKRPLPWRSTGSPYHVWLSEVILQQTRVAQGTAYYLRFVEKFPSVEALAHAPIDEVLKAWEGLGYYSRARNLHFAAQQIVNDYQGTFPTSYEKLRTLKGVGNYTAAAIASICFKQKVAAVDGNVNRVLARLHGIMLPVNSRDGANEIARLAAGYINQVAMPGDWNEAMMEFGALICTPKKPGCNHCPISTNCVSYQTGNVNRLPVKLKAKPVRHRYFNFLLVMEGESVWIEKRGYEDIWAGLYQLPLLETKMPITTPTELPEELGKCSAIGQPIIHLLSHQRLHITFWQCSQLPGSRVNNAALCKVERLTHMAFPIVLKRFIESNLLLLPQ
jgi:A/G-specific adenine glycosylase